MRTLVRAMEKSNSTEKNFLRRVLQGYLAVDLAVNKRDGAVGDVV